MENTKNKHIAWVDLLRVIACLMVVIAHCCDPFVARLDADRLQFLSGAFWGSLMRPSVPLFVMMSAVLLLPVKMDMHDFYVRRMKRIIIPLIIWSILTPVLYFLYFRSGVVTLSPNIMPTEHTWSSTLNKMYTFIFNFNYTIIPLWYLYMLVGLYLFMPIISAWLLQASQREIKLFLKIWIFTLFLPYIQIAAPSLGYAGIYGNMGLLGVCDWNPYGMFHYFSGFLGYVVLAYYLVRFPLNWSWKRTCAITIPVFLIGFMITTVGFILTQKYFPEKFSNLEIIWYFCGINTCMMTFSIFVLFQKIRISYSTLLNKLASLTFGIYLCHFLFVQAGYDLIYMKINLPAYLLIPINAVIAFTASLVLVWLLSKNKYTRKMIM